MAMYMAVFLPYLVSDPSFTVLYVPLVHIQQYTIFNTKPFFFFFFFFLYHGFL